MDTQQIVAVVGAIVTFYSYIAYFRGIFNGTIKPHCFSWLIWGMMTATGFAAQIWGGAGIGSVVMGITAMASLSIAGLSVWYGEQSITRSDWAALVVGLLAIPLWMVMKTPAASVVVLVLADAIGCWPSLRKSWHKPHQEGVQLFALAVVKHALALMAMTDVNWVSGFQSFGLIFNNTVFVAIILYRRRSIKT